MSDSNTQLATPPRSGFSGLQVLAVVLITMGATALGAWWLITTYVFPSALEPVELSRQEQIELDRKLEFLGVVRRPVDGSEYNFRVVPEPYTEGDAPREINISERELNSLFASDPEMRERIAVDLSPDLVSLTALVPIPEDFPVMPGEDVRVRAGAEFSFSGTRPVLILKGVSVMGVPLPNAWLGNLKNIDLIADTGNEGEFWQAFADGIEDVQVEDGRLRVTLSE